jgi:lysophospholipase L1-like esterase
MAKIRSSGLAILIAAFVTGSLAGAIECGARFVQYRRLGPRSQVPALLKDRWAAWRNNPAFARVDITHNAQGFRRRFDVVHEKPSGTVRLFFMGGSAAYGCEGLYTHIDDRFTRLYDDETIDFYLEQKLNRELPQKHWEVINAAVNEYRLHQHLALLLSRLLQYDPDCVILMDGHNDISGLIASSNYDPYAATSYLSEFDSVANPHTFSDWIALNAAWLRNNSVFYASLERRLSRLTQFSRGRQEVARHRQVPKPVRFEDLSPGEQQEYRTSWSELHNYTHVARQIYRVCRLNNVKVAFAMQPELILSNKRYVGTEESLADYHRQRYGPLVIYSYENFYPKIILQMRGASAEDSFPLVDLTGVFDDSPMQTFSDYCHMTPDGNRIVADRLFADLEPTFRELAQPVEKGLESDSAQRASEAANASH